MDRSTLSKIYGYLRGFLLLRRVKTTGPIKVYGRVKIKNPVGKITIGKRSKLYPGVVFDFEAAPPGTTPEITIGEFSSLGDRTEIHCGGQVIIGDRVSLSWDVLVMESDYHTAGHGDARPRPIIIEDDVWIGARSTILKGVRIGHSAIVGACAVVTKDVPPYSVVAGNPARIVKTLTPPDSPDTKPGTQGSAAGDRQ